MKSFFRIELLTLNDLILGLKEIGLPARKWQASFGSADTLYSFLCFIAYC
jgi:hypothetical protein